jgi:histidinol phosphatase-like enzyme
MKKTIFLDFDGVLNNTNFMIFKYILKDDPDKEEWEIISDGLQSVDSRNMHALNFLLSKLQEKKFDIEIVISSAWRDNMNIVMDRLREHNILTINGEEILKRTKIDKQNRGLQILDFCKENNIEVKDIIVIDDDLIDIKQHIPDEVLLHTNFRNGLTFTDVLEFLNKRTENND